MQMFPSFEKKKVEEMIRGFVWFCPPSRVPPSERPNFLKGSLHSLRHSSRSTIRFPVEIGTTRTPKCNNAQLTKANGNQIELNGQVDAIVAPDSRLWSPYEEDAANGVLKQTESW